MYTLAQYFIYFLFYSLCGWILEVFYCMIVDTHDNKKFTISNRGFLNGPICPIYGVTAVAMSLCLTRFYGNPIPIFLVGVFVADTVEYLTSYLMEKIFNARWWDYKKEFLNINGRICLKHSVMWGILSLIYIELVQPLIIQLFSIFGKTETYLIFAVTMFLFLYDVVNTIIVSINIIDIQIRMRSIKEAFSQFDPNSKLHRANIPEYAMEFRNKLKSFSPSRRSRMLHIMHEYPAIMEHLSDELEEMQSVPHEFRHELKFLKMDMDTYTKGVKKELY